MTALALLALVSPAALANPYQLVAVYEGDGTMLEVPFSDGVTLPDRGEEYHLARVLLRFDQSGLGATSLSTFRNFAVGVSKPQAPAKDTFSVDVAKVAPTYDLTLLEGTAGLGDRVSAIEVDVRAKFQSEFLCGQELLLRRAQAERPAPSTTKVYYKEGKQPDKPIFDASGTEILYSYCAPDTVDWAKVDGAGAFDFGLDLDAKTLPEEHKRRLAKTLATSGTLKHLNESEGGVQVAADQPGYPINVYLEQRYHFSVLRTARLFSLTERGHDGDGHRVALDSRSKLTLTSPLEGAACTDLQDDHLSYWITDQGSSTSPVAATSAFRHACGVQLDVDLSEHLQETIEVSAKWDLEGKAKLTLYREDFDVYQLGVVTSFPVVSEIVAAAQGGSAAAVAEASSVPLGAAIPTDGGAAVAAVTFPWKLAVNTRELPNLATYLAVYPHVTLLFEGSEEAGTAPVVAYGAGVALAEAFHFSWALTPSTGDHYIVVGVSIQDIAELSNLF